ncbi:hypothetical protein U9M48_004482, partial [Paspalum notatum var. saurae]
MLAIIINRAKTEGKVNGVIPHLVEDGFMRMIQPFFLDHDLEKAKNMKIILCVFEKLSGLKINFHKSEIFCVGQAKECENAYSEVFGCKSGSFPFRYLGLPMHYRKLRNSEWRHIEERFEKQLIGWKGKLLSVGGRLVLINSVLSSLPMFMLSFFAIPKGHKKKYHLIKWDQIRQPKEQGGLGIIDLEVQNKCLLSKWLYKLANENGIRQSLLRDKYLKSKPLGAELKGPGFLTFGLVRFWEDTWCGNRPLKFLYPSLFNIVADVMRSIPLNISFRRGLYGERLNAWNELVGRVMNLELGEGRDMFNWSLNKTIVFTVRSMYKHLVSNGIKRGVLLTKDNLARRNWNGYQGAAALFWAIWLQRNDSVFDRKQQKKFLAGEHSGSDIGPSCSEMKIWLTQGGHNLEVAALQIFN